MIVPPIGEREPYNEIHDPYAHGQKYREIQKVRYLLYHLYIICNVLYTRYAFFDQTFSKKGLYKKKALLEKTIFFYKKKHFYKNVL